MYTGVFDPGMGPYRPRVVLAYFCRGPSHSAIGRWSWGFHTVRGGITPGDNMFRPRVVAVLEMRRDFQTRGGALVPGYGKTGAGLGGFLRGATPAARAAAPHWPGAGAFSTNGLRVRETLRWKLPVIMLLIYYEALRSAGGFRPLR